jgi:hypothetical protein
MVQLGRSPNRLRLSNPASSEDMDQRNAIVAARAAAAVGAVVESEAIVAQDATGQADTRLATWRSSSAPPVKA